MSGLSNSRYEELLRVMEQQEEEAGRLAEQNEWMLGQINLQSDYIRDYQAQVDHLKSREKELEDHSEELQTEIKRLTEENLELIQSNEQCRQINTELQNLRDSERKRSISTCSAMREKIRHHEIEKRRLKGVLTMALLYSILVTLFKAVTDGQLINELKGTGLALQEFAGWIFKGSLSLGEKAGIQSQMKTIGAMKVVSYYLSKGIVIILINAVVILVVLWVVKQVYSFYRKRMLNIFVLSLTAISLAVIVWFGVGLQRLLLISHMEMIFQTQYLLAMVAMMYKEGDQFWPKNIRER